MPFLRHGSRRRAVHCQVLVQPSVILAEKRIFGGVRLVSFSKYCPAQPTGNNMHTLTAATHAKAVKSAAARVIHPADITATALMVRATQSSVPAQCFACRLPNRTRSVAHYENLVPLLPPFIVPPRASLRGLRSSLTLASLLRCWLFTQGLN